MAKHGRKPLTPDSRTLQHIKDYFEYNPETGQIFRFNHDGSLVTELYAEDDGGYIRFEIFGRKIRSHHVAWFLHYGEWPVDEIDHRDRIKTHNYISNLRYSNPIDQRKNTNKRRMKELTHIYRHKFKGVTKFRVRIKKNQKLINYGIYDTIEEAIEVRDAMLQGASYGTL